MMKKKLLCILTIVFFSILIANFIKYSAAEYTLKECVDSITIHLELNSGWSMVSLPVEPDDFRVSAIFPGAPLVYTLTTKYILLKPDDLMEIGRSYWLYVPQNTVYSITGKPIESYTILDAGTNWIMLGSCSYPSCVSVDTGVIKAVFTFTSGNYEFVGTGNEIGPIKSGYGYWIILSDGGRLNLKACIEEDPLKDEYNACGGNTFYLTDCLAGECVAGGLEERVFQVWQEQFMTIHGLSEEEFNEKIKISNVNISEGPYYVWVRIDYIFVKDWMRSRQSESINLGTYPLSSEPSDEKIRKAVNLAIEKAEQFDVSDIASLAEVEEAFDNCLENMTIDWCHIDFENVTGILNVRARKVIDWPANKCKSATVDLATGNLLYCYTTPCRIY